MGKVSIVYSTSLESSLDLPAILYEDLRLTMELARRNKVFVPIAGVTSQVDLTRYRPAGKSNKK